VLPSEGINVVSYGTLVGSCQRVFIKDQSKHGPGIAFLLSVSPWDLYSCTQSHHIIYHKALPRVDLISAPCP
jgi:hypothetical protein